MPRTPRPVAPATLAALALALLSGTALAADATATLRVLETTDIHANLFPYDYYRDRADDTVGLVRTAALIAAARDEAPNTLMIDNGDLIQGSPLGDYMAAVKGLQPGDLHPVYKVMNRIGYDVGNLGNHEFNYGIEYLEAAIGGADFPYVSANVFIDDGGSSEAHFIRPYVLLERTIRDDAGQEQPITIGVIGFVPPQIMVWDRANLEGRLVTRDIVDTATALVPQMRADGADIVIAVAHSGFASEARGGMDENAVGYLTRVPGIDAVLFGHAHKVFPSADFAEFPGADVAAGTINGVPSVMPGFWGSHLGVVDLHLALEGETWTVAGAAVSVPSIYERPEGGPVAALVESVPALEEAVRAEHEATIDFVGAPVGQTTAPINSYFALVADDPSIQIVTDAQTWYVGQLVEGSEYDGIPVLSAGAPFKAGGRGGPEYFTDIPAGEIAIRNVADLYLYPNTVRAVLIDGAGVADWLEMSAGIFNTIDPAVDGPQPLINPDFPSYNYDVIDGVTYRIDVTQPPRFSPSGELINPDSHRIRDLAFEGSPIDPAQRFVVATNNYRAAGGGNFPGLDGSSIIIEAPDTNRDVVVRYIMEQGEIDPSADDNWSFEPLPAGVTVTFESGAAAEAYLPEHPGITAAGSAEDGFAVYALDLAD